MLVASEAERLAEAQRRIAICRETRGEHLDLSGLMLRAVPDQVLALDWLTSLDLAGNDIGADGARALAALTGLTDLNLRGSQIGDDGARALAALTGLTDLNLAGNRIGDDGARALAALTGLTDLNLWHNRIRDDGARALAALTGLTSLDLGDNEIGADGARALAGLTALNSLNLRGNQIGADGARALAALTRLTSLNLGGNRIGDDGARALAALTGLTSLNLWSAGIGADGARALVALTGLTSLNLWNNQIGADGARALAALTGLTHLNLRGSRIGADGARALAALTRLTSLDLWNNGIGADGARALAALTGLTSLDLGFNQIGDDGARALAVLTGLTSLDLWNNGIGADGARALAALTGLTSLILSGNQIGDFSPLLSLPKLETVNVSECHADQPFRELWFKPSLRVVVFRPGRLPGVPSELLSKDEYRDDCLPRLRAFFEALDAGASPITDVKVMLLGNGRVGKTKIARRLAGEAYGIDDEPSTHGVQVKEAALCMPVGPEARLKVWDFGGQDMYHGTHALFLKSRAVFPVVWTPQSEKKREHTHGGFTFRNQPLGYWLAYVRQMGGAGSPVVVIQSQADVREAEDDPPVADEALEGFETKPALIAYSAKTDRKRGTLNDALVDAVTALRHRDGEIFIPQSWDWVKTGLEVLFRLDQAKAVREHQLYDLEAFGLLCQTAREQVGPVDDDVLLGYLHDTGTLFYRKGLFGDRIILDQQWALDAVYAVFDRDSQCFRNIERYRGHFRRSDLSAWLWDAKGYTTDEQTLFISFMQQCGICFPFREGDRDRNIETEFVAPDLLPATEDEAVQVLLTKWGTRADAEGHRRYPFLPHGLLRTLMSKVGAKAGLYADYWRDGFTFYETETRSNAKVWQAWDKDDEGHETWSGEIHVATRDGDARDLLARILRALDEEARAFGAKAQNEDEDDGEARVEASLRREMRSAGDQGAAADAVSRIAPAAPPPGASDEYCVSYAWGDGTPEGLERERIVDDLCAHAEGRGITIIRDKTAMGLGDRISQFIARVGRGRRVFIVLSDKYLKSAYCMHELFEVWRNCREDDSEFLARTRVYVLPSAAIKLPEDRAQYVIHWQQRFAKFSVLVKEHGQFVLSDADNADYRRMSRFVHETANILRLVQDILKPRNFEDFVKHGFDD